MPTVRDNCPCGARFEASGWTASSVHAHWLRMHLPCRSAAAAPRWPWPTEAEVGRSEGPDEPSEPEPPT